MEKFIFLFKGYEAGAANLTTDQLKAHLDHCYAWMHGLKEQGLLEAAQPLQVASKQITGQERIVTDGPFAEAKEAIGGYVIVLARDQEKAMLIARGCPVLDIGGTVEVHKLEPMDREI